MTEEIEYETSSGNVFEDIGIEKPDEYQHKAMIAARIYSIIQSRELTQAQAAKILGVSQPKVSALKNGILDGFSIERLFKFLHLLDQDIDIVIQPKKGSVASFSVVTG